MTIKVYISGISGSHEVRKQQQRVLFILQSLPIDLKIIDVTDPGMEEDLNFMQEEAKKRDKKTQLPPQIFNDNKYCGDYTDFALANDDDEIMRFLKLEDGPSKLEKLKNSSGNGAIISQNGINHESNKDELGTSEEPTSNGIHNSDDASKDAEPEPMTTEEETNQAKVTEPEKPDMDADKPSEEVSDQANVPAETDVEKKESSEEESE